MDLTLDQTVLDNIIKNIHLKNHGDINKILKDMHAMDISILLSNLDTIHLKYIFSILNKTLAAEIIKDFEPNVRQSLLKRFSLQEIATFLEFLDSDDIADILIEVGDKRRKQILSFFKEPKKVTIINLLNYDENTSGGLMATELIKVNINWEIHRCREEIRKQGKTVHKVYSIYVLDDNDKLLGIVSLKKIIMTEDNIIIREVYDPAVIKVESSESKEDVVDIMQRYDLESLPVVNTKGVLLGRITIDDIVDVITEQAETTQQMMSGISEDIEDRDTIWTLCRARLPWVIIGIFGGLLGAMFIGFFQTDLMVVPAMIFFIPLITATGGNVGIQSSTLVVQSMSNNPNYLYKLLSKFLKTTIVSVVNASIICLIVFIFSISFIGYSISLIVAISLFCVAFISSLVGTLTPVGLHKLNINPALASGPFITTLNDLIGLAIYFMVARILIPILM